MDGPPKLSKVKLCYICVLLYLRVVHVFQFCIDVLMYIINILKNISYNIL